MSQQPDSTSPSLPATPAFRAGQAQPPASIAQTVPAYSLDQPPQSFQKLPEQQESSPLPDPIQAPFQAAEPERIPHWLVRFELFLRVLLRMYIGLAVCVAPWWSGFWDQNPLFLHFPTLGTYAANGAVRGLVSGLGLLNLWIAFRDAIRHRGE
jgi:hypothetical protein